MTSLLLRFTAVEQMDKGVSSKGEDGLISYGFSKVGDIGNFGLGYTASHV